MFQPEGRNSERLEHGRNSLFFGCCANVPDGGTALHFQISYYSTLLEGRNSRNSRNSREEQACSNLVPTCPTRRLGRNSGACSPVPRWCVVRCPVDRRPRSLFGLWLAHYRNECWSEADAHDLARLTCRALYPEARS